MSVWDPLIELALLLGLLCYWLSRVSENGELRQVTTHLFYLLCSFSSAVSLVLCPILFIVNMRFKKHFFTSHRSGTSKRLFNLPYYNCNKLLRCNLHTL